jgi:phosphopantothenoylcysteine decarboxylase/phosphopantothenate--cysteine ligase
VENGFLASGLEGPGRMLEPEAILREVEAFLLDKPLAGRRVLITAGPTREAIDPVRYISNHSTGKMGYALAAEAARMGAEVLLVSGPVALDTPPGTKRLAVQSAQEMFDTVMPLAPSMDLLILSAAVADYTPETVAEQKIKKSGEDMAIRLKKTPDILATLGTQKGPGQVLVGFALETNNELEHARQKLERKRADLIVLNSLRDPGAGFGTDTNQITLLRADGAVLPHPLLSKQDAAREILRAAAELLPPLSPAS